MVTRGNGVGQSVRPDRVGFGIINAHAAQGFRREFEAGEAPEFFHGPVDSGRGFRHHAAQGRAFELRFANELCQARARSAVEPTCRGNVRLPRDASRVRKPDVRVGVADVEEQKHGAME
jgi:hypothetical protein